MKIRSGFVSNSSSSSFIVNAKSSMEVFLKMIGVVYDEYKEYDEGAWWKKHHEENVMRFIEEHADKFNEGIIIPFTCNFATYIFPARNGQCYVETCNNHPWESVFPDMFEDESECRHYEDGKTSFVNVSTGEKTTAKKFTDDEYAKIFTKLDVKKEDVSCGFKIGLYMTNDECDQLNTLLTEEGYDLEDYRACTKFLLERAGIYVTPNYLLGEDKLTHMDV
jgi:hypothetical protein